MWSVLLKWLVKSFVACSTYILPAAMVKTISDYFHIFSRDSRFVYKVSKVLRKSRRFVKEDTTLYDLFYKSMQKNPDKVCYYLEDAEWTYRDVDEYSSRVASSVGANLSKGDVVVLLLHNCAEYSCIWLGLSRVGIITALINTNLKQAPLLHCINSTQPKAIIYSDQFDSVLSEILDKVEGSPTLYSFEGNSTLKGAVSLPQHLQMTSAVNVLARKSSFRDVAIYIFTSGTTGMPKPAKITQSKLLGAMLALESGVAPVEEDIIYCVMPLYHLSGTLIITCTFCIGLSSVIKPKFSASSFISDCIKYKATLSVYIGEMIRYLVDSKKQPGEKDHKLRLVCGNGLRVDVWRKFVERFNVPLVKEYYSSTECNFFLINSGNVEGACGFLPIGVPYYHLTGPSLIKTDKETGQPVRDANGLCIRAEPGEVGLCVGYCPPNNEMRRFQGYINNDDTESKIIRNVYKQGDMAFNTGDLLEMDERGWLTFVDRLGDTFRWKGENVSTTEVEAILNTSPDIEDCAVYGVQVGNLEGKAGMAAVLMKNTDIDSLDRFVDLSLPHYARPLFIRLVDTLQYTSTFKVVKTQLKKQGFDIVNITDPVLVRLHGKYTPISADIYDQLQKGLVKL